MTRKKLALKRKAAKKAEPPAPRLVEHKALGVGTLKCVRALDNGEFAAVAEFGGTERVIRLDQSFWITSLFEIMQAPLEPARKHKAEAKAAEPAAADEDATEPEAVVELALNDSGHLSEGDAPEDEDEEIEREESEMASERA